ncbi:hypothetical protein HUG20_17160 [Salicibibacter cibi]|uniref:Uncharacterized protein n=2 Tax=Salicibibacter cibi TaxID=2743001 RepID=A0A7T7CGT7_9BACI|nr:hypothetical protein HUG20_17160 [Salicibibacter cibi]
MFQTTSFIRNEIQSTNELIRDAGYEEAIHFRPPFGKKLVLTPLYLSGEGIDTITWDMKDIRL